MCCRARAKQERPPPATYCSTAQHRRGHRRLRRRRAPRYASCASAISTLQRLLVRSAGPVVPLETAQRSRKRIAPSDRQRLRMAEEGMQERGHDLPQVDPHQSAPPSHPLVHQHRRYRLSASLPCSLSLPFCKARSECSPASSQATAKIIVFERNVSDLFFSNVPASAAGEISAWPMVAHADPVLFGIVSSADHPIITCFGVTPSDARIRKATWLAGDRVDLCSSMTMTWSSAPARPIS